MSDYNPFLPLTEAEQLKATELVFRWFAEKSIELNLPTEDNPSGNDIVDVVVLKEPTKKSVEEYERCQILPKRMATYTVWRAKTDIYYDFTILYCLNDINNSTIVDVQNIKRGRPAYTCADNNYVVTLLLNDRKFKAGLAKRGIYENDYVNLYFDVAIDGLLDNVNECLDCEKESTTKVLKTTKPRPHVFYAAVYWNDGQIATTSAYVQPIEGLWAFVDRRSNTVIEVVDTGKVTPIQKGNLVYTRPDSVQLKPLVITQPDGPSFTVVNNVVSWGLFKVGFGMRADTGLTLYDCKANDRTSLDPNKITSTWRNYFSRGGIAEILTLYGKPEPNKVFKNFCDFREYPMRDFVISLTPGIQVPSHASLYPAYFTYPDGSVGEVPDAIAIFETDDGSLYSHVNYPCGLDVSTIGSRKRTLHIMAVNTVGNYDFIQDYQFTGDGNHECVVSASGILECSGTTYKKQPEDVELYGNLINSFVNASNHSHRVCFRYNMKVDGPNNRIKETSYVRLNPSKDNPCGNAQVHEETLIRREKDSGRFIDSSIGGSFEVCNHYSKNELGQHRALNITFTPMPRHLVNKHERIGKRAELNQKDLYVTKYREGELSAMGDFPVERGHDQGLRKYLENDESVVDTDNVIWAMTGFGHSPTCEQAPVMNNESVMFKMAPHGFYNCNPALYLVPIVSTGEVTSKSTVVRRNKIRRTCVGCK